MSLNNLAFLLAGASLVTASPVVTAEKRTLNTCLPTVNCGFAGFELFYNKAYYSGADSAYDCAAKCTADGKCQMYGLANGVCRHYPIGPAIGALRISSGPMRFYDDCCPLPAKPASTNGQKISACPTAEVQTTGSDGSIWAVCDNADYVGNTMKTIPSITDAATCANLCLNTPGCASTVLDKQNRYCHLKDLVVGLSWTINTQYKTCRKISGPPVQSSSSTTKAATTSSLVAYPATTSTIKSTTTTTLAAYTTPAAYTTSATTSTTTTTVPTTSAAAYTTPVPTTTSSLAAYTTTVSTSTSSLAAYTPPASSPTTTTESTSTTTTTTLASASSTPAPLTCGVKGWDKSLPPASWIDSSGSYATLETCESLCSTKSAKGFGFGGTYCLCYPDQMADNLTADPGSPYTFYDLACSSASTTTSPAPAAYTTSAAAAATTTAIQYYY